MAAKIIQFRYLSKFMVVNSDIPIEIRSYIPILSTLMSCICTARSRLQTHFLHKKSWGNYPQLFHKVLIINTYLLDNLLVFLLVEKEVVFGGVVGPDVLD